MVQYTDLPTTSMAVSLCSDKLTEVDPYLTTIGLSNPLDFRERYL